VRYAENKDCLETMCSPLWSSPTILSIPHMWGIGPNNTISSMLRIASIPMYFPLTSETLHKIRFTCPCIRY